MDDFHSAAALHNYFNIRVGAIFSGIENKKTMIGWNEILHADLPQDVVIQGWQSNPKLFYAAWA